MKTTEKPIQTGAGPKTNSKAAEHVAPAGGVSTVSGQGEVQPVPIDSDVDDPGAPEPTEDRLRRPEREGKTADTAAATQPEKKDS